MSEYREQTFIDKSTWAHGQWDNEPDRISFIDDLTGYPCILLRGIFHGAWCGYVGIPEGHPDFGKDFNKVDVRCHWGLSYGESCNGDPETGVCHVKKEGEPEVYWFGFDCCHCDDLAPRQTAPDSFGSVCDNGVYRTREYAQWVTRYLALQFKFREINSCMKLTSQQ